MDDPVSDDVARQRWAVIQAARLSGVALVVIGVLITNGAIAQPHALGYVLLGVGLVDLFFVPAWLARKWRSPRP